MEIYNRKTVYGEDEDELEKRALCIKSRRKDGKLRTTYALKIVKRNLDRKGTDIQKAWR